MRIGSLFSGYGGLDLAVEAVTGATPAWFVEFDQAPSRVLAHHWPDVPNYGDITAVDWDQVERVDILTGGFPCQDLSHAGKRLGLRPGTRSGLWEHMAYAIDRLRPRLVVIENVRGLLSAEAHSDMERDCWCVGDEREPALRALGAVLGDLAELGYDARWGGVRAADAGAPHGRFRVFIVATPANPDGSGGHEAVEHDGRRPAGGDRAGVPHEPDRHPDGAGPVGGSVSVGPQPPEPVALGAGVGAEVAGVGVDQGVDGGESLGLGGGHASTVPVPAADLSRLLPTPIASDWNGSAFANGARDEHGRHGVALRDVPHLLPTPQARDHKDGGLDEAGGVGAHRPGAVDSVPRAVMSLLPTPSAADGLGGHESRGGARGHERLLAGIAKDLALPPTATASMATGAGTSGRDGGPNLQTAVGALLPTPRAQNGEDRNNLIWARPAGQPQNLENALANFGPYAAAVARWEQVLGRRAPSPTEPGKDGRPRLSPSFVEWMMGLPAGHVTDPAIGLTRAQQLKALGNGVVPQQAALALRLLLNVADPATRPDPARSAGVGASPLLPTPNPFHAGNEEDPDEWRKRRADVFKRTGTRHGPALGVVAKSLLPGEVPLTPDTYMPEDED